MFISKTKAFLRRAFPRVYLRLALAFRGAQGQTHRLTAEPEHPADVGRLPALTKPKTLTLEERVELATLCRDCDVLPKVADAGAVITDDDGARVQVMHNGIKVLADGYCGSWATELIRRSHGHHEPQEECVFHSILERMPANATMIELGAWWSYYSLWFLKDQPGRRALALEPVPEHRALGEANAARNGLSPRFIDGFVGATSSPSARFPLESGATLTIPRRSVAELIALAGFDTLDILHCDAQGVELEVLTSCAEMLRAGRIRTIVVSTHHHSISGDPLTHQRCLDAVEQCGGVIFAEHDVQESFSGDGLIAARFGPDRASWGAIPISYNRYSTSLFRNPLFDMAESLQG